MIRTIQAFTRGILTLAPLWRLWIGLLLLANGILPLYFIGSIEGKVVLACMLFGATLQMFILRRLGFVRLLGVGHVTWIPMIWWLTGRLEVLQAGTLFHAWILATIALDTTSLAIDAVDVTRWLRGERTPTPSRSKPTPDRPAADARPRAGLRRPLPRLLSLPQRSLQRPRLVGIEIRRRTHRTR